MALNQLPVAPAVPNSVNNIDGTVVQADSSAGDVGTVIKGSHGQYTPREGRHV